MREGVGVEGSFLEGGGGGGALLGMGMDLGLLVVMMVEIDSMHWNQSVALMLSSLVLSAKEVGVASAPRHLSPIVPRLWLGSSH